MTQGPQAGKCTQQTALSRRDTEVILLSHETLDKVTNGIESHKLTFKPLIPVCENYNQRTNEAVHSLTGQLFQIH